MQKKYSLNILELPVYFINLDRDVEKKDTIVKLLKSLGFTNINRFPGIQADPKRIGVAKSHHALLTQMLDNDLPVIIFEDDIDVHNFNPIVEVPVDADAYYLGNSTWGMYCGKGQQKISISKFDEKTHKIHNMLAAHAILYLNKDYLRFLHKAIKFNISIETNQDKARAETMKYFNVYSSSTPMFYQKGRYEKFTKVSLPSANSVGPEGAYL